MALNKSMIQGRIPFEIRMFNEGDEKRAVAMFALSVRRNYKPAGEQYYPEDLIDCKAFGQQANFINEYFEQGSFMILEGEIRRNDDYEDSDGNDVRGQMYFHITGVHFQQGGGNNQEQSNSKPKENKSKRAPKKAPGTNPFSARRKKII